MKRKLYVELPGGSFREPTVLETRHALLKFRKRVKLMKEIEALEKQLDELESDPCKVFYDEPSFPYDIRHYVASGNVDLI